MALSVAGATTTRYPAVTTARQTPIAPAAPGVTMPRPMAPTPQSILAMDPRQGKLANRQLYQSDLTAARAIADPAARRAALQAAYQASRARYQNLGRGYTADGPFAFSAQDFQPGLTDARSQARTSQVPPTGAPAPAPASQPFRTMQAPQGAPAPTGPSPVPVPTGVRPATYPSGIPSVFQPRNTSGIPDRAAAYGQSPGALQNVSNIQSAQQALLGPLGKVFGLGGGSDLTLARGDIPLLEAGLNFENVLLAERDRQLGYNELARAQAGVGSDPQLAGLRQILGMQSAGQSSPEMEQALALASQRAGREGQFAREATATRDAYTGNTDQSLRALREDYARRGVQGNESMLDEAMLRQSGGIALNRALADLEARQDEAQRQDISQLGDLAGQERGFQQASIEQLLGQIGQEEGTRTALGQALANVFLETEREPFDLSGLTTPLKDKIAALPVAGPTQLKLGALRKKTIPYPASQGRSAG